MILLIGAIMLTFLDYSKIDFEINASSNGIIHDFLTLMTLIQKDSKMLYTAKQCLTIIMLSNANAKQC